jgi:hypothetical protein
MSTMGYTSVIVQTSGCPWPKATVKPPVWKSYPKIEIPHPENHVLKVFRFRSWKPRVWKSRPQSWDPKSWKPSPENHVLKFSQVFSPGRPALPVRQTLRKVTADNFPQFWLPGCANSILIDCQVVLIPYELVLKSTIKTLLLEGLKAYLTAGKTKHAIKAAVVFSGAKVAELRHRQSGPDPARHPVLDVGYPGSPFRARMSFAHRLGTGNSALRLAPGPVCDGPELRHGQTDQRN